MKQSYITQKIEPFIASAVGISNPSLLIAAKSVFFILANEGSISQYEHKMPSFLSLPSSAERL
jgi:hypothetical protein